MGSTAAKKHPHEFRCEDHLWELFKQKGNELECSSDYLLNEAMRLYARCQGWEISTTRPAPEALLALVNQSDGDTTSRLGERRSQPPPLPPQPSRASGRVPRSQPKAQSQARPAQAVAQPVPVPIEEKTKEPTTSGVQPSANGSVALPPLYLVFNGRKIRVNKKEFVIGRGTDTADFAIRDGNVSRRHAIIVFEKGAWYLKDLGSTNGVQLNGRKVDNAKISSGDVLHLCTYQIQFAVA